MCAFTMQWGARLHRTTQKQRKHPVIHQIPPKAYQCIMHVNACNVHWWTSRGTLRSLGDGETELLQHGLQIFPCFLLRRLLVRAGSNQVRRMVRRHHGDRALVELPLSAKFGDPDLRFKKRRDGRVPHRDDHFWAHDLHLAMQVGKTGCHLVGGWLAILGRTALDNVAHVDVCLGIEPHCADHLVEQLARSAYKGKSCFVLVCTGGFANETNPSLRVAT